MSDEQLTTELAVRGMRWRVAPDRFLKPEGGWTSRSGFRPLTDIRDAVRVLETVTGEYSIKSQTGGRYVVAIRLSGKEVRAAGKSQPRTICAALAQIFEIQ